MAKEDSTQTSNKEEFKETLKATLEATQAELLSKAQPSGLDSINWERSKNVVERFQPIPWFIWRLSNFVFGQSQRPNNIGEGMVLGLRKILLNAASDKILGKGTEIKTTREAFKIVRSDVIASASIIQSISRKLHTKSFKNIWKPILDDAILRAHIGFFVGQMNLDFGPGRGMLAGFAGRVGLAILIATGSELQAEETLTALAAGKTLSEIGKQVYGVEPLQVSAMTLSACGCGKDAAFGTFAYSSKDADEESFQKEASHEQKQWLAAFTITEAVRVAKTETISEAIWQLLSFSEESEKENLRDCVKILVRKGHGWDWMM